MSALSLGFFLAPTSPLSYELGCELTFPVGEAFVVGILLAGSEIMAVI